MATPGADFATLRSKAPEKPTLQSAAEAALQELEKQIASNRDRPISALLNQVVERVGSIMLADGAAIAVRDQGEVICRASVGEAPEVGSRLRPDSALTRECFETGQVVICEDTETDYRVHRATAKSLRLRCAVVVPLQAQDSVVGVIEVLSSHPSAFNTTHVAGLQRIGALLAHILVPAPASPILPEPPQSSVLPTGPGQSDESMPIVLVSDPALMPPDEPRSRVIAVLVAGAVVLLLLLYFAVVRSRPVSAPSAPAVAPASVSQTPAGPVAQPQASHPDLAREQPLESGGSQPELS